jgi:hypothetical protein
LEGASQNRPACGRWNGCIANNARVCVYTFDGHHRQRKFEPKKKRKIKSLTKNQKENKTKRKGAKTKGNEKINRRRRRIRKASERAFSE